MDLKIITRVLIISIAFGNCSITTATDNNQNQAPNNFVPYSNEINQNQAPNNFVLYSNEINQNQAPNNFVPYYNYNSQNQALNNFVPYYDYNSQNQVLNNFVPYYDYNSQNQVLNNFVPYYDYNSQNQVPNNFVPYSNVINHNQVLINFVPYSNEINQNQVPNNVVPYHNYNSQNQAPINFDSYSNYNEQGGEDSDETLSDSYEDEKPRNIIKNPRPFVNLSDDDESLGEPEEESKQDKEKKQRKKENLYHKTRLMQALLNNQLFLKNNVNKVHTQAAFAQRLLPEQKNVRFLAPYPAYITTFDEKKVSTTHPVSYIDLGKIDNSFYHFFMITRLRKNIGLKYDYRHIGTLRNACVIIKSEQEGLVNGNMDNLIKVLRLKNATYAIENIKISKNKKRKKSSDTNATVNKKLKIKAIKGSRTNETVVKIYENKKLKFKSIDAGIYNDHIDKIFTKKAFLNQFFKGAETIKGGKIKKQMIIKGDTYTIYAHPSGLYDNHLYYFFLITNMKVLGLKYDVIQQNEKYVTNAVAIMKFTTDTELEASCIKFKELIESNINS